MTCELSNEYHLQRKSFEEYLYAGRLSSELKNVMLRNDQSILVIILRACKDKSAWLVHSHKYQSLLHKYLSYCYLMNYNQIESNE